jgi:hypothetical protein
VIVNAAKRKKKKKEVNSSDPLTKWADVKRVILNVKCSSRQVLAGCELDQVKDVAFNRLGQAKKEKNLSLEDKTNFLLKFGRVLYNLF